MSRSLLLLSAVVFVFGLSAAWPVPAEGALIPLPVGAGPGQTCNLGLDGNGDGDFDDTPGDTKPVSCMGKGYYCKVPSNSLVGKCSCAFGEFEMPLNFGGTSAFGTTDVCKWVNSQGNKPLLTYVSLLVNIVIALTVALGLVMIVIGGFFYMTAGGDGGRISTAKTFIGAALLGIILALTAFLILNTISPQFASDVREPIFKTTP